MSYTFTLYIETPQKSLEDWSSDVYNTDLDAGCGEHCGESYVDCTVEAASLDAAIQTALAGLTPLGLKMTRVEIEQEQIAAWPAA